MKGRVQCALFLVIILIFAGLVPASPQGVRKPVWAGQFYEADPTRLSRALELYISSNQKVPEGKEIVGLISPHAGYLYSGRVAGAAYALASQKKVETVVIIGPSHHYGFKGCSIYPKGGFETPLGVAEVDEKLAKEISRTSGFSFIPQAHQKEHSVEVQVPFIQKTWPSARIVPIVMGYQSSETIEALSSALYRVLKGKNVLVVASTDMSHFLTMDEAHRVDRQTIELVKQLQLNTLARKIERAENIMCGGGPLLALLKYAQKLGRAEVLEVMYSDSAAAGGPTDRVVGYFSALVLTEGKPRLMEFTQEEKKQLLVLARQSITHYLETGRILEAMPENPKFRQPSGAFVTLRIKDELRGCIGFVEPVFPLYQTIIQSAVYAATQDPRFPPLRTSELSRIKIEISVLGPLEPVDDVAEIEIGKHGLLIKQRGRSGLLLPQVATEFGWDRSTFLVEVCRKAGLPDNAWRQKGSLYKFEAVVFEE
ncbi:MAG: AmmeMemoRadiSam system protein B [Candidatus Aminicenantes bacterium]|nr:AmmeMemoRadiSam system protein B [Candidatus Aminicenantes bacterium]